MTKMVCTFPAAQFPRRRFILSEFQEKTVNLAVSLGSKLEVDFTQPLAGIIVILGLKIVRGGK